MPKDSKGREKKKKKGKGLMALRPTRSGNLPKKKPKKS